MVVIKRLMSSGDHHIANFSLSCISKVVLGRDAAFKLF
jgi:hypothetical protein